MIIPCHIQCVCVHWHGMVVAQWGFVNGWPQCQANSWADSSKTNSPGKPGDTRPTLHRKPSGQCFQLEVRKNNTWNFITCLERFLNFHGWNPHRAKITLHIIQLKIYWRSHWLQFSWGLHCAECWVATDNKSQDDQDVTSHRQPRPSGKEEVRGQFLMSNGLIALSEHNLSNPSIGFNRLICNVCNESRLQKSSFDTSTSEYRRLVVIWQWDVEVSCS